MKKRIQLFSLNWEIGKSSVRFLQTVVNKLYGLHKMMSLWNILPIFMFVFIKNLTCSNDFIDKFFYDDVYNKKAIPRESGEQDCCLRYIKFYYFSFIIHFYAFLRGAPAKTAEYYTFLVLYLFYKPFDMFHIELFCC